MTLTGFLRALHNDESGQDLVEYALVVIAIASAAAASSGTITGTVLTWLGTLGNTVNSKLS